MGTEVKALAGEMESESTAFHSHERHQLLMVTEGLMLFEDESKRSILCGTNAALIPAGCLHCAQTMGQKIRFLSLYFSSEHFTSTTGHVQQLFSPQIAVFSTTPLSQNLLRCLCQSQTYLDQEPEHTMLRLCYLLLLREQTNPQPFTLPQSKHPIVRKAIEWIDQRYAHPLMLEDLEKQVSMSGRSLQRLFQKELGMTPFAYVRLRRVFQASIGLTTTDKPILEISLDVGYDSLSSFYQAFVHCFGKTPREYRCEASGANQLWET